MHWSDGQLIEVWCGDARETLRGLADESVHCVVTSPPYWGLRDYGTGVWSGGDPACPHVRNRRTSKDGIEAWSTAFADGGGHRAAIAEGTVIRYADVCPCGAQRTDQQIGLEVTPDAYAEKMVEVFREVRRVLRSDGTLWLNMGDGYASHDPGGFREGEFLNPGGRSAAKGSARNRAGTYKGGALKPKDLIGMPWRLAFALQADGWYLRCDIVWSKPNPMPESVTDRPTKAHEYVFLLSKSGASTYWTHRDLPGAHVAPAPDWRWVRVADGVEVAAEPTDWRTDTLPDGRRAWRRVNLWRGHDYFYDADAIREAGTTTRADLLEFGDRPDVGGTGHIADRRRYKQPNGRVGSPFGQGFSRRGAALITEDRKPLRSEVESRHRSSVEGGQDLRAAPTFTRNARSVWTIATQPYPDAHFATFPEELPRRCILAGTSAKGCCPQCGAPWERVTERAFVGWRPTCGHTGEPVPCTVLDPFAGSGTTLAVSKALDRAAVGIELNPDYVRLIRRRVEAVRTQRVLDLAL